MLIQKSFARITLCLDIIRKLSDGPFAGYHEIHAVKHQIDLSDTIYVEESDSMELVCDHPSVPLDASNTCLKAADMMRNQFDIPRAARITIKKNIPVMGGLAGGSSNAATVMIMLNELWNCQLTSEELCAVGRSVGMDVPYFFYGKTAFDTEAGGITEPVDCNCRLFFVIVLPDFGVSTKDAYSDLDYSKINTASALTKEMRKALEAGDFSAISNSAHNDFEYTVFRRHPKLAAIKQRLRDAGCSAALLSGSGSTMIGIAPSSEIAHRIAQSMAPFKTIVALSRS